MTLDRITIVQLNSRFMSLTGYNQPLTFHAEQVWHQWMTFTEPPWTVADLELVIGYIRARMRRTPDGKGYTPNALRFDRLIQDAQRFCEILGPARAEARTPKPTPRTDILAATGRPTQSQTPAQPASAVFERTKLAQQLKEWKEQNL